MKYTILAPDHHAALQATMNTEWHLFDEKAPPEQVIVLVNGPLGIDLAVHLEDNLYFKKGDDWSPNNLELWQNCKPTHWADLTPGNDASVIDQITFSPEGQSTLNISGPANRTAPVVNMEETDSQLCQPRDPVPYFPVVNIDFYE